MLVKDCMTKDVIAVKKSTTLRELMKKFRQYNYHMFPVVDEENKITGTITFSGFGGQIFSTIVATTIVYELIGPICTRRALDKSGEI